MKVLLLDAMNLIHRARSGFGKGEHPLVFSFFRSFKPIVEKFNADCAYFVLEGKPAHRTSALSQYKSNRKKLPEDFWRQQGEILKIMESLPVFQIRHPNYECDDVIANLAKYHASIGNEVVVVSGDSDFIQLFDTIDENLINIFHPIKKKLVLKPDFNYLTWKSLKGDVSDNIPGIKGIGEKTATKIVKTSGLLEETLKDPNKKEIFERNKSLIEFHWFSNLDNHLLGSGVDFTEPTPDFKSVRQSFEEREFSSMLNQKYWEKFQRSFDTLMYNIDQ